MHRVNFGKCSGVIVDICRPHGTWFDANELHHIVEFIRAGGLEQARSREKAELVNERIRAQAARTPIEPHAGTGPGPDLLSEVVSAAGDILLSWLNH